MTAPPWLAGARVSERAVLVPAAGAVAAAALGAVAVGSPKLAVEALAAGIVGVVTFSQLAAGVAIFAILTFPEDLPGALHVGGTVAKPLGLLLALAWIGGVMAHRTVGSLLQSDHPTLTWLAVALIALATASLLWTRDISLTTTQLTRLVQDVLLMFIVYTAASTGKGFRWIVGAFLAASVVTSIYSITTGSYIAGGRLGGIFDPNYFAAELIPALMISFFLTLTARTTRIRLLVLAVLAVDLTAFALTQSRGGVIGLAFACLAAVVVAGGLRPRVLAAVMAFFALGGGYYATYAPAHLKQFSGTKASSGRSDEWRIALKVFEDHPLQGVGLGNFTVVEPAYASETINLHFVRDVVGARLVAHNSYLEPAAELGVVGLLLFVAILVEPLRLGWRGVRRLAEAGDELELYGRGLIAGAAGMFVSYIFLSAQYEKQLWLVLGLLASLTALARTARPE